MLEIKNLSIEFQDNGKEQVVKNLSLSMQPGEIIGLVGESGSGKTMTALALAGLLKRSAKITEGSILFEGMELVNCEKKIMRQIQGNEISIVFQEPMTALNPVKTIGFQVEEALKIHTDMTSYQRREKALQALQEVELPDAEILYKKYPHQLSGGMRQRVLLASALICEPKLLIADEPTTALDVTIQAQIIRLLKKINETHHTGILFISHNLALVRQLCSRVAVMYQGEIAEEGSVQEVLCNPKQEYTKHLIASIPRREKRTRRVLNAPDLENTEKDRERSEEKENE